MKDKMNQSKWVAVVNRKVPLGLSLAALIRLAAEMRQFLRDQEGSVPDSDGVAGGCSAASCDCPVVVLQVSAGGQLRDLRSAAMTAKLPCLAFVASMFAGLADRRAMADPPNHDPAECVAVLLAGNPGVLDSLTGNLSPFAQPPTDTYGRGFHTLDPH